MSSRCTTWERTSPDRLKRKGECDESLFNAGIFILHWQRAGMGLGGHIRRFFSAHHWVNPGFLVGPYLPLYGSSLCVLYLLAMLEPLMPGDSPWLKKILLFVVMALAITALEYVAGMIFIHGMKIKLWDYSDRWGNVKGIICPLFTFFWLVLSAVYYFLIHPHILSALHWLAENLAFSFCIGFFYGIFLIDVGYSTHLMVKIRALAAETNIVVRVEELREDIHQALQKKNVRRFFFPMHGGVPVREMLDQYVKQHFSREKSQGKWIRLPSKKAKEKKSK